MISTPPMPTRFMASRSAVMPSLVMLPLSQNQYTHGRHESGGDTNFSASAAVSLPSGTMAARAADEAHIPTAIIVAIVAEMILFMWILYFARDWIALLNSSSANSLAVMLRLAARFASFSACR